MRSTIVCLLAAVLLATAPTQDDPGQLRVIATVPTYGDLARSIGGDLVDVVVACRPGQDIHGVMATPSLMARSREADLVLHTGLDAELWLEPLLRGSANYKVIGTDRWVVLSDGIPLKEVPAEVSRRGGDLHAFGNTHLWTDPLLVRKMAAHVRDALVAALPTHAEEIEARYQRVHDDLTKALVRWLTDYADLKGKPVVTYHSSWIYFLDRFGLRSVGTLEPKPRVAPTASHLESLIQSMKEQDVKVIIYEPYQDPKAVEFVAEATGAKPLLLSTHPGFPEGVDGIIEHFDHNLAALAEALGVEVSHAH